MQFFGRDAYAGQPRIPATMHGYSYAHNNPINYVDPSGFCVGDYDPWGDECWRAVQKIEMQWKVSPEYWQSRFGTKTLLRALANQPSFGYDFWKAQLDDYHEYIRETTKDYPTFNREPAQIAPDIYFLGISGRIGVDVIGLDYVYDFSQNQVANFASYGNSFTLTM